MQGLGEELAQGMLGLRDVQSMQIKLRLNSILAAPQLAQDGALQARTMKHELLPRRESRIIRAAGEALPQNSEPICASKACARSWAWPPHCGSRAGYWLDVPHRLAEETGVVVFGFGLHN